MHNINMPWQQVKYILLWLTVVSSMTSLMDSSWFTIEASTMRYEVRSPGYFHGMDGVNLDALKVVVTTLPYWRRWRRPRCPKECGHATALPSWRGWRLPWCSNSMVTTLSSWHRRRSRCSKSVVTTLFFWLGWHASFIFVFDALEHLEGGTTMLFDYYNNHDNEWMNYI